MKKLPIGIQNIRTILEEDYIYVDKTDLIRNLCEDGPSHFYFSRPGGFGRSLLLSTLREIFNGNKELFKGLKIYNSDYLWKRYPVIYIDLNQISGRTSNDFEKEFIEQLKNIGKNYGVEATESHLISQVVRLIKQMSNEERVIVLIDNCDNPVSNQIQDIETAKRKSEMIKKLLTVLKSLDQNIKLTFITGENNFTQGSMFGGPNHLFDITMSNRYSTLLGYTEKELLKHFGIQLKEIGVEINLSLQTLIEKLRGWYGGYRFSNELEMVYNPYSIFQFLENKVIQPYWHNHKAVSFFIEQVKKDPGSMLTLSNCRAMESDLAYTEEPGNISSKTMLFQAGYLTVKNYHNVSRIYSLDFPNKEAEQGFFNDFIKYMIGIQPPNVISEAKLALENHQIDSLIDLISHSFSNFSSQLLSDEKEGFYPMAFRMLMEHWGFKIRDIPIVYVEKVELVIEMPHIIYIFSLEMNQETSDLRLEDFTVPIKSYLQKGKEIGVIKINSNSSSCHISDWQGMLFSSSGTILKELTTEAKKISSRFRSKK